MWLIWTQWGQLPLVQFQILYLPPICPKQKCLACISLYQLSKPWNTTSKATSIPNVSAAPLFFLPKTGKGLLYFSKINVHNTLRLSLETVLLPRKDRVTKATYRITSRYGPWQHRRSTWCWGVAQSYILIVVREKETLCLAWDFETFRPTP